MFRRARLDLDHELSKFIKVISDCLPKLKSFEREIWGLRSNVHRLAKVRYLALVSLARQDIKKRNFDETRMRACALGA
jgi:hypothetical protein